jgi:glucose-6-phosphate isomerase
MKQGPFGFEIVAAESRLAEYDQHIERRLSALRGQFLDGAAYTAMLERDDNLLYEVFENQRPHVAGELLHGLSVLHPGKVGDEYFMTKGHFHTVLETGEVYHCLQGQGLLVMETPTGDWAIEEFRPGRVVYVPPCWAHRSVNTGTNDLVTFFVYPGNAGHDYGTIERQGFRKCVVDRAGTPCIIDNPRWSPPTQA